MMHHPVLSAGKGRFNALIYGAFRHVLGDADLVIAGHDHSYMRTRNFVVLNAAGSPKAQQTILSSDVSDAAPVYGVLTVDPSSLDFNVYHFDDGQLIDSLYVRHD